MSECQIGCITSDDEGRGYYCEECPERRKGDASTLVGPDGFTPLVSDADYRAAFYRVMERCEELKTSVAEHQWNALEMARKADQAERRAEEAEFHVEQLRDALGSAERRIERTERLIDSWERDAPDHSNPTFIGRLRESLRCDPAPVRLRIDECDHDWLDRPESDTRECLICGAEALG